MTGGEFFALFSAFSLAFIMLYAAYVFGIKDNKPVKKA